MLIIQSCPWVGLTLRVGLGWVGLGRVFFIFAGLGWVGQNISVKTLQTFLVLNTNITQSVTVSRLYID